MEKEDSQNMNWPILGHKNIVKYLERLIEKQDFLHTYLFTGPRDIGKKTMADLFVKSIFCSDKNSVPCNHCNDCIEISKFSHPDYIFVDREEGKKNISIEQVRDFQSRMSRTPMRSKYKIGLINNADSLNKESANALLKTIEEPSKSSMVILMAEKIENILPTIRSRSQNIIFNNVSDDEIYENLKSLGSGGDMAQELSKFAGGSPGIALHYFKNQENWNAQKIFLNQMLEIIDNPLNEKFFWVESMTKKIGSKDNQYSYFENLLDNYLKIARDLIIFKVDPELDLIHSFLQSSISKISRKYSYDELISFYKNILSAKKMIFQNVNPRILLENILII